MKLSDLIQKHQKVPVKHYPHQVEEKPMVSVCVQTYQHVGFIKQCLDGILMQHTTFPFEILLGEDESTDGTREICIEYAQKYPDKIRLFLHSRENNIKVNNRATGRFNIFYNFFKANGQYIALCEGDDYWTDKFKLQKQVDFLEANDEFVLSFHDCKVVDDSASLLKSGLLKTEYKKNLSRYELTTGTWLPTLSVMFRKEKVNKLPSSFCKVLNLDTILWAYLGQFGNAHYDESTIAVYTQHSGGIWSEKSLEYKLRNNLKTLYFISQFDANKEVKRVLYRRVLSLIWRLIKLHFKKLDFVEFTRSTFLLFSLLKMKRYK